VGPDDNRSHRNWAFDLSSLTLGSCCGPRMGCAPCTSSVRRWGSPSLLMCSCGSLCPEFRRPGCSPRSQPTSRLLRKRCASSSVSRQVSAIRVPTPFNCFSSAALLGQALDPLAIFADAFAERFSFCQQRLQCCLQFRTQPSGFPRIHVPRVARAVAPVGLGQPPRRIDQRGSRPRQPNSLGPDAHLIQSATMACVHRYFAGTALHEPRQVHT
jgi:hypothetical protein